MINYGSYSKDVINSFSDDLKQAKIGQWSRLTFSHLGFNYLLNVYKLDNKTHHISLILKVATNDYIDELDEIMDQFTFNDNTLIYLYDSLNIYFNSLKKRLKKLMLDFIN
jgi:hypothetical protein